jgi:hypothetical protein
MISYGIYKIGMKLMFITIRYINTNPKLMLGILEPEAITDIRIRQLRNRSISEYLIKSRKLSAEDSTWEDQSFIQKHPELLKRCG